MSEDIVDTCGNCGELVEYTGKGPTMENDETVRAPYKCPHCGAEGEIVWDIEPKETVVTKYPCPFEEGDRVEVTEEIDLYPDALIKKGERGTVTDITEQGNIRMIVSLDTHHDGLSEWDNNLHIKGKEYPSFDKLKKCHDLDNLKTAKIYQMENENK